MAYLLTTSAAAKGLESWLKALVAFIEINRKIKYAPNVVLMDQGQAERSAVESTFGGRTRSFLCVFHILKAIWDNLPSKLTRRPHNKQTPIRMSNRLTLTVKGEVSNISPIGDTDEEGFFDVQRYSAPFIKVIVLGNGLKSKSHQTRIPDLGREELKLTVKQEVRAL